MIYPHLGLESDGELVLQQYQSACAVIEVAESATCKKNSTVNWLIWTYRADFAVNIKHFQAQKPCC